MSRIRIYHIKLAQVTILDHFLQKFDSQYINCFSWRNSNYEIKGSTDHLYVTHQYSLFMDFVSLVSKTYSQLITYISPPITCRTFVAIIIYICRRNDNFCRITEQTYRQIIPPFAARISGVFTYVVVPSGERWNY